MAAALAASGHSTRGRLRRVLHQEGQGLVGLVADAFGAQPGKQPLHQRLARGWKQPPAVAELLRTAMVLLLDHELTSSAFAARIAASNGASLPACLLAGLHDPGRRGVSVYGAFLAVAAIAGLGVAARQSWMQWFPPAVSECGPGLEYMLESFPLSAALPMIFRGAGDCSVVDWTFLGLSIANWSLLSFTTILVALTVYLLQRARQTR